jgi:hypothetical protein
MFVLQSCTDPLQVLPGSSNETFPTSSDGTLDVGKIKVEKDIDMPEFEEVNVKTEVIFSEEEECIDIKEEEDICTEEEEDIDTKEEKDVDVKEEVSWKNTA